MKNFNHLLGLQTALAVHPMFKELSDIKKVRQFMEIHVWAVWDFMSLLKRLQRDLTCVTLPWKPSPYSSKVVRLINEIVLGEESDVDQNGEPTSHFELYLRAMQEVGADTTAIEHFIQHNDSSLMPREAQAFVSHTLELVEKGETVEVAAAFFYGREKVIPGMFQGILDVLMQESIPCPTLNYYLERHIHLDGEQHGPMSEKCLNEICRNDEGLEQLALAAGIKCLEMRSDLWTRTQNFLVNTGAALDTHPAH